MTQHQRRILAAMALLGGGSGCWRRSHDGWLSRYDIGAKVNGQGAQLRTMLALRSLGLVTVEHEVALELVRDGVCRCGCDRWDLTLEGSELVETWNVKDYSRTR